MEIYPLTVEFAGTRGGVPSDFKLRSRRGLESEKFREVVDKGRDINMARSGNAFCSPGGNVETRGLSHLGKCLGNIETCGLSRLQEYHYGDDS
jgi:hypothetical protein